MARAGRQRQQMLALGQMDSRPALRALATWMVHVHLNVSSRDWLDWATNNEIHPWVVEYIQLRPDHLAVQPPKHEEPFSSPRSWHMLSDALREYDDDIAEDTLATLAFGCLSPAHAGQFRGFIKQRRGKLHVETIIKGKAHWPTAPEDRDVLYFLAQSFRARIARDLPADRDAMSSQQKELAHRAKALMKDLAAISLEMAQLVVADDDTVQGPPGWFLVDLVRDLPRLVKGK